MTLPVGRNADAGDGLGARGHRAALREGTGICLRNETAVDEHGAAADVERHHDPVAGAAEFALGLRQAGEDQHGPVGLIGAVDGDRMEVERVEVGQGPLVGRRQDVGRGGEARLDVGDQAFLPGQPLLPQP